MRKRFFIIDGMALVYRSFYALNSMSFTRADGTPVSAVLGTALFLSKLLLDEKPDYIACAWDSREKTFRSELYPEYKKNRLKAPDDLLIQLPFIKELFNSYGIPMIEMPGVEADDLIASIALDKKNDDMDIFIVAGDKDYMQILCDGISLYIPKKSDQAEIVTDKKVKERFGFNPEHIIDYLALLGDASDNVPGVKGVGEKTAQMLISAYGSIENVYAQLYAGKCTARQISLLTEGKDSAFLSKKLVTLKTDLHHGIALKDCACDAEELFIRDEVLDFYQRFEFKNIEKRILERRQKNSQTIKTSNSIVSENNVIVSSDLLFNDFINSLKKSENISFFFHKDALLGNMVSFYLGQGSCYLFLRNGENSHFLYEQSLWRFFYDENKTRITFNTEESFHELEALKQYRICDIYDVKIMTYLHDVNENRLDLEFLNKKYLKQEEIVPYSEAQIVFNIFYYLKDELYHLKMDHLFRAVETPLTHVLFAMEKEGIYLDQGFLKSYEKDLEKKAKEIEDKIYQETGEKFNINSPKQLKEIIFDKLKIHENLGVKLKKTKTGFSTDESVLAALTAHPVPQLVLDYRQIKKVLSTYVKPLPQFVGKDGRIHAKLRQTNTRTGRLSSDSPNLQNIPMRRQVGQEIRKAFCVARPDHVLISADYSQIEIRLLAHFSKVPSLIEAFHEKKDIHSMTAAKIFHVDEVSVTKTMRSQAKAINFGIIYGMGPQRLAKEIDVSFKEAKEFIDKYFAAFPGIKDYLESLFEEAKRTGYTDTLLGRKRKIVGLFDQNAMIRAHAKNTAINSPLQGSAADLIKLAMVSLHKKLATQGFKTKMLLQIHDELLFEAPQEEVAEVSHLIRKEMEHCYPLSVPLSVDLEVGQCWFDI